MMWYHISSIWRQNCIVVFILFCIMNMLDILWPDQPSIVTMTLRKLYLLSLAQWYFKIHHYHSPTVYKTHCWYCYILIHWYLLFIKSSILDNQKYVQVISVLSQHNCQLYCTLYEPLATLVASKWKYLSTQQVHTKCNFVNIYFLHYFCNCILWNERMECNHQPWTS